MSSPPAPGVYAPVPAALRSAGQRPWCPRRPSLSRALSEGHSQAAQEQQVSGAATLLEGAGPDRQEVGLLSPPPQCDHQGQTPQGRRLGSGRSHRPECPKGGILINGENLPSLTRLWALPQRPGAGRGQGLRAAGREALEGQGGRGLCAPPATLPRPTHQPPGGCRSRGSALGAGLRGRYLRVIFRESDFLGKHSKLPRLLTGVRCIHVSLGPQGLSLVRGRCLGPTQGQPPPRLPSHCDSRPDSGEADSRSGGSGG